MAFTNIVFPSPVIFKGDNDANLKVLSISCSNEEFLQFSGTKYENESKFEVIKRSDGYVGIKSLHNGRYWSGNPGEWIEVASNLIDEDCLFKPILLKDKRVAFLFKKTTKYVKRLSASGDYINFLNADLSYIDESTLLTVEEPVARRTVKNIIYDTNNAVITDLQPLVIAQKIVGNDSSCDKKDVTVNYNHTYTRTKSWNNSFIITVGVETSFECGIPFIAGGKVFVSAESTYTGEWGSSEETTDSINDTITINDVKPNHKVKMLVHGERSKLTVPFKYKQVDYLSDGTTITKILSDGAFYGIIECATGFETCDIPPPFINGNIVHEKVGVNLDASLETRKVTLSSVLNNMKDNTYQKWKSQKMGDDTYRIIHTFSNLALDANPNREVFLSPPEANKEDNLYQRWRLVSVTDAYRIIHDMTGLALDAEAADCNVYLSTPENNHLKNPCERWWLR
ncbi:natterin-like protein [Gigaspora margarita]|uniref:Natterin-like protein n=1 Tax=Gigaspora margarita TaxID=4874 RepID=A0A8H4AN94_GIGMA|nr:natterin-like protein [Gigaspora margarita]